MNDNQHYSILANELIRRLRNTNHEQPDMEDTLKIIEVFTQQLKSSGYTRKKSRECNSCPEMQKETARKNNLV